MSIHLLTRYGLPRVLSGGGEVTLVWQETFSNNTQNDGHTFPAGSSQENDVLFLIIAARLGSATESTVPTGFAEVAHVIDGALNGSIRVYRKIATSSESATYEVAWGNTSTRVSAALLAYRGVDTDAPIADSSSNTYASGSEREAPSVDAVAGGRLLCAYNGVNQVAGTSSWTHACPDHQENLVSRGNAGNDVNLGLSGEAVASTAATGSRTATFSQSKPGVIWLAALNPA